MWRLIGALTVCVLCCHGADTIRAFGLNWAVPVAADWKVASDGTVELLVAKPSTQPRRPSQFAVAQTPDYLEVTIEADVKKEPEALRKRHTSLMFAFAYKDPDHFLYAHLSVDSSEHQPVHNGIFKVDGGDRVRISPQNGPGTLLEEKWYHVKLVYNGRTGDTTVWVNGQTSPSLHAVNKTFGAGKVGIGSFFDLGSFRNVKISGKTE